MEMFSEDVRHDDEAMIRQDFPTHWSLASALAAPTTDGNFGLELSNELSFLSIYTNTLRGTPIDQRNHGTLSTSIRYTCNCDITIATCNHAPSCIERNASRDITNNTQSDGEDDTKSQVSAAAEVEVSADASTGKGQMSVLEALKGVLKLSLIHDGLARGLREASKALDRRQAHMCVLNEACEEEAYKKLVVALCSEHKIPLIKVPDGKQLGEWAGLCMWNYKSCYG